MPYVQRDINDKIIAIFSNPQNYATEYLDDNNSEVVSFLATKPLTNSQLLSETDQYMSRASEDLIVTLLSKGVIAKTDYPQLVWDRINYRRSLRNQAPI